MALEDTLKNLVGINEKGERVPSSEYKPRDFYKATEAVREISGFDVRSKEGLEGYMKISGDGQAGSLPQEEVGIRKGYIFSGADSRLLLYADKHFRSLVREIGEKEQMKLAFEYCPQGKSGNEKYDSAVKIVRQSKETLEGLSQNPLYISQHLIKTKATDSLSFEVDKDPQAYMNTLMEIEIRNAKLAMRKYGGVGEFLTQTHSHFKEQKRKLIEEGGKIEEAIATKRKMAEENAGRVLTSAEQAGLIEDKLNELRETEKKYRPDAEMLESFTKESVQYANYFIGQRIEEEKKKPESKKKK